MFPILFPPITHDSPLNLYSNKFLTSPVSRASAATARRKSPGGRTQYLSRISHVVPHESVIAIIAERWRFSLIFKVFKPYKTLNVPDHPPMTDICILSFFIIYLTIVIFM